jgi:hypothetical protein
MNRQTFDPTCYIGVDLITEQVTMIARRPDDVRDYMLEGQHSRKLDGTIYLSTEDQTFNGRRALAIALAETESEDIGLGWRFAVART